MGTACIAQVAFGFESKGKRVVATFDVPDARSDGGAILLKSVDTSLGLTRRLAACRDDGRQAGKVRHQTIELLQQRVFGLACGYADCNDAARLVDDPIHKLLLGRDPLAVWVERSVRRIMLQLPASFPWLPAWRKIARAVGATS